MNVFGSNWRSYSRSRSSIITSFQKRLQLHPINHRNVFYYYGTSFENSILMKTIQPKIQPSKSLVGFFDFGLNKNSQRFITTEPIAFIINDKDDSRDTSMKFVDKFIDGPPLTLGFGKLANQAYASVVGKAGSTIVLATVSRTTTTNDSKEPSNNNNFLTVEYRQRFAAVGQIPDTKIRRDNTGRMTNSEILASRVIDRSLRPLLRKSNNNNSSSRYHIHCSVQSCNLWPHNNDNDSIKELNDPNTGYACPISIALNSASAAMAEHLIEPVAAVTLGVLSDGTIITNPGPSIRNLNNRNNKHSKTKLWGELLYTGTRDKIIMLEWKTTPSSGSLGLPEAIWDDVLRTASIAIQPTLDTIEELIKLRRNKSEMNVQLTSREIAIQKARESLGLPPLTEGSSTTVPSIAITETSPSQIVSKMRNDIISYCEKHLGHVTYRLFGYDGNNNVVRKHSVNAATKIHDNNSKLLLTKQERGLREQVVSSEVARLIHEYFENHHLLNNDNSIENSYYSQKSIKDIVVDHLFRKGMYIAASKYGTRADGRGNPSKNEGWITIRPIRLQVPALPDSVHGSALFSRGDTQVLCTVTLGPPRYGLANTDPYQPTTNPNIPPENNKNIRSSYGSLPVGSLRFLRTQEALMSDLNSRKVKAEKELTGDSGILSEVQNAFLHYDFPSYSTGTVPDGESNMISVRRSIGHGTLAERAILPVIPENNEFPYTIRMTSEVTDSSGSSSMASICGTTLALLDAGVPLRAPVAGVSVGLAMDILDVDENGSLLFDNASYTLLTDITGTEDHYGCMDFKIAGTRHGVTAMQLDVKHPIPLNIIIEAISLARNGREKILSTMSEQSQGTLGGLKHRSSMKDSAPSVEVIRFDPMRKRDLVGPGGAVLRQIEDRYGISLDLSQEGRCLLYGSNRDMVAKAKATVMDLVSDVVQGDKYVGTVIEVKDFGAVVELLRNKEGLLHVSEYANIPHSKDREILTVGQKIEVLCIGLDPVEGSVKLSRKNLPGVQK